MKRLVENSLNDQCLYTMRRYCSRFSASTYRTRPCTSFLLEQSPGSIFVPCTSAKLQHTFTACGPLMAINILLNAGCRQAYEVPRTCIVMPADTGRNDEGMTLCEIDAHI